MLSIYNKISDYIVVLNYAGEIIFCNESFLKRLNYIKEDVLNLNILKIIKSKENNVINELIEIEDKSKILDFCSKSNEIVRINSNITIEYFNNEKSIFIVGNEVNSKPYTMEMLEDILDNIKISTFVINKDGKYLYANKSFANMFNLTREDIIGKYNSNYWQNEICEGFEVNNREVFENKRPKVFHEKLVVDDNIQWNKSYKCPVYDENEKFKYIVATSEKINL